MAGRMSQNKGKRGEREVIAILQPIVSQVYQSLELDAPLLQRNTLQAHRGGCDIVGLEWLALEVKLQQATQPDTWWKQAVDQCGQHQKPVLFYRKNNVQWKVRCLVTLQAGGTWLTVPATLAVPDWLRWFRATLIEELTRG